MGLAGLEAAPVVFNKEAIIASSLSSSSESEAEPKTTALAAKEGIEVGEFLFEMLSLNVALEEGEEEEEEEVADN